MEMKLTSPQTQTSAGQLVQIFLVGSPCIPHFHTRAPVMTCPGCTQGHSRTSASSHTFWSSERRSTYQQQSPACLGAGVPWDYLF